MSGFEFDDDSFRHLPGAEPVLPVLGDIALNSLSLPHEDVSSIDLFCKAIEQDAANYEMFRATLLSQLVEPSDLLDARFYANVPKDPYDYQFMWYMTQARLTKRVHLSDNAVDMNGNPLSNLVAVHTDKPPFQHKERQTASTTTRQQHPLTRYLRAVCSIAFNPEALLANGYTENKCDLLPSYTGDERQQLLLKGFMTGVLIRQTGIEPPQLTEEEKASYLSIRGQGYKPFNTEQLYGMMEAIVRTHLSQP